MSLNIIFFGSLTEIVKTNSIELEFDSDLTIIMELLLSQYPGLKNSTFRVAVNEKFVSKTHTLNDGDTIAFLPPFSGG